MKAHYNSHKLKLERSGVTDYKVDAPLVEAIESNVPMKLTASNSRRKLVSPINTLLATSPHDQHQMSPLHPLEMTPLSPFSTLVGIAGSMQHYPEPHYQQPDYSFPESGYAHGYPDHVYDPAQFAPPADLSQGYYYGGHAGFNHEEATEYSAKENQELPVEYEY